MKFILILLFFFFVPAHAGVFKCTDPNGKVTYSSDPCIDKQKSIAINIDTGVSGNHEEEQKPQDLTPESNAQIPASATTAISASSTQEVLTPEPNDQMPGQLAVPKWTSRVTDLTATLNAEQIKALETRLAKFEAKKGSQIAVLILPTTQSEDIAAFGLRVAKTWKIGRKNINDGVILIVAKDDRKLRLEVGRGLEKAIPDTTAQRILAETIKPHFKIDDYEAGIDAGITELMGLIDRENLPEVSKKTSTDQVAVPKLSHRVTDLTATLNTEHIKALETRLAKFEAKKGSQIAVLILPTTQSEDIAAFGLRVAKTWKIGRKNINDGVILIVAKDDRKLRLEVGRGLEKAIPDTTAQRILAETIKPHFKIDDYEAGIDAGISQLIALIGGETLPETSDKTTENATNSEDFDSVQPAKISSETPIAPSQAQVQPKEPEPESFTDSIKNMISSFFVAALYFLGLIVAGIAVLTIPFYLYSIGGSSGRNSSSWRGGGGDFNGSGASDSWGSNDSSSSSSSDSSSSSSSGGGGDFGGSGASDSW